MALKNKEPGTFPPRCVFRHFTPCPDCGTFQTHYQHTLLYCWLYIQTGILAMHEIHKTERFAPRVPNDGKVRWDKSLPRRWRTREYLDTKGTERKRRPGPKHPPWYPAFFLIWLVFWSLFGHYLSETWCFIRFYREKWMLWNAMMWKDSSEYVP